MENVASLKRQIRQKKQTIENLKYQLEFQKSRLVELETKAKKSKWLNLF